jgi:c(7)-type cytochrome triheme protein
MTTAITLRRLFRNYVSLIGGIIAAVSFITNIFLLFLDYLSRTQNPYVGIVTYMILPGVTMGGLGLVFFGAALRFFQLRRGAQVVELPRLDLNNTRHRLALFGTFVVIIVFLGLSAVGGYESYHYTDSVAFCGKTCHTVMEPEYTAYQGSAHARVACVACHIGPGAEWYVKSKINGAYQVYSVLFDKFSRPIPTPISHLRPSQDICEQCHWPEKFWGEQLASRVHFSLDEKNSRREVHLLIKTGGGGQHGLSHGIHWHMNIANKVFYAAADARRQVIPWVKTEGQNGEVVEYISTEKPLTPEQLKKAEIRRMDCMDCHNRPSHRYLPPGRALDPSFEAGRISTKLPYMKRVAVEAMSQTYDTAAEAEQTIERHIRDFYAKAYPNVLKDSEATLRDGIAEVKRVYRQNFFPSMRVSWQAYPENIGHKEFPGCFRCHDGKHVSKGGKIIRNDCAACHDFLERRTGGGFVVQEATASFAHPWKLGGKHAEILCGTCHTGEPMKPATCRGCHEIGDSGTPMAAMECKECHQKEQQVKPLVSCANCHPAVAGLHKQQPHKEAGCVACHAPHAWSVEGRDRCLTCHGDKAQHNPGPPCAECHDFAQTATPAKPAVGSGPPAITFPADPGSPGKVTFEHAKHLGKGAKCADCHPKVFAMKRGGAKLSMDNMGEGKACGACHDGKKAFGVMDGEKCVTCHKET